MRNPIYVSTEELPIRFGDPKPHGDADRRVLIINDDLAAELETLAKSLNRFILRDALRWLGERNVEYRIKTRCPNLAHHQRHTCAAGRNRVDDLLPRDWKRAVGGLTSRRPRSHEKRTRGQPGDAMGENDLIDEPDADRQSERPVATHRGGSYYPAMALAAEQVVDLYERHARDFDQERGRSLWEKPWLDRFLALLPPRACVVDIGCGCGEPMASYLLKRDHRVTGIDSSATLIEMCRSRFPEQEWIVSDMRKLSLNRRFQGLLAWDSFFHLCPDDQRSLFPIFRMHAAPGAALLFTSGPAHGEAMATWHGEPLYHSSLDEAEYRLLLARNGFSVVSHIVADPSCGKHTVWLAQLG